MTAEGPPPPLVDPFAEGEGVKADLPTDHLKPVDQVGFAGSTFAERTILDVQVVPELCMNFLNCMRIATGGFGRDPATRRTRPTRWQGVEPTRLWRAAWSCPSGAIRFITDKGYVNPRWEEAAQWRTDGHPAAGRKRAAAPTDPA